MEERVVLLFISIGPVQPKSI